VTALWPTRGQPYIGVAVCAEERSGFFSEFGNRVKALRQKHGEPARLFFATMNASTAVTGQDYIFIIA